MNRLFLIVTFLFNVCNISAQNIQPDSIVSNKKHYLDFHPKQLIIPVVFFSYGIVALESDYLKLINTELRDELKENIDERITIDDFTQYLPALSAYALNMLGIKAKNNRRDRFVMLGSSYLLMSATVLGLKRLTRIERPTGGARTSFPSGHTATAFLSAEFLWQEYKKESIWYGIAGYLVATGTGFYRIINARHWLSDVVMGAGIGILSMKVSYWTMPWIKNKIFKPRKSINPVVQPGF